MDFNHQPLFLWADPPNARVGSVWDRTIRGSTVTFPQARAQLSRVRRGVKRPGWYLMYAIREATHGRVMPNDFL